MEYLPELFTQMKSPFIGSPLRGVEDVFQNMFKPWVSSQRLTSQNIPLDVIEFTDKYLIRADLPGIDRKAVDISFENGTLLLKVQIEREEEKREATFLVRERLFSSALRTVQLPLADFKGTIDAVMKDGVLKISVPKAAERQTKKIEIH